MKIVLLGPPGAGKGTQAEYLVSGFGLTHVSTGDLFRENLRLETPLGLEAKAYMDAGQLVPDSLTVAMLLDRISRPDCAGGYLLDGFPRNTLQAEALSEAGEKIDAALLIDVDRAALTERITGRRICRDCQRAYHVTNRPPQKEGVCDECGGELYQRADDTEETVAKRLDVYFESTEPLIGLYAGRGILKTVQGDAPMEQVRSAIAAALQEFA